MAREKPKKMKHKNIVENYIAEEVGGRAIYNTKKTDIDEVISALVQAKGVGATYVEFDINRVENHFLRFYRERSPVEAREKLIDELKAEINEIRGGK